MMSFSFQNVIDGNGITITVLGMLIVFAGLAFISVFINYLPGILVIFDRLFSKKSGKKEIKKTKKIEKTEESDVIASLIGLVIHMELELSSASDNQQITISQEEDQRSNWGATGKIRSLR